MFTKVKLKQDIDDNYGIVESYDIYSYGKSTRVRALLGVNIVLKEQGSDTDKDAEYDPYSDPENYLVSEPHVVYLHELVPMSDRENQVTPYQYIKAKKAIITKISEKTLIVGVEAYQNNGKGKTQVYEPSPLSADSILLKPSSFELPEEVTLDLIKMVLKSKLDRVKFLELRIEANKGEKSW